MYVRDLDTGLTQLASRAGGVAGATGNGTLGDPADRGDSGDGRYVAFHSNATNLSPDDTDATSDLFVRDLQTQTTTLVSRATGVSGAKGNGASSSGRISADGRYVAFLSQATNLDPADGDTADNVYLRDLQVGTTTLIDRASGANGAKALRAFQPSLSGDGRYVAFFTDSRQPDA